jgi:hypothetical protein
MYNNGVPLSPPGGLNLHGLLLFVGKNSNKIALLSWTEKAVKNNVVSDGVLFFYFVFCSS